MKRIKFNRTELYESEGRNLGPTYHEGSVHEFEDAFADRWLRRGSADEVDKRTPLSENEPLDLTETAPKDRALSQLDHDGDGAPGGSLPYSPPALSGKSKPELLKIAEDENVDIEDGATIPDIRTAIELAREEKAKAE